MGIVPARVVHKVDLPTDALLCMCFFFFHACTPLFAFLLFAFFFPLLYFFGLLCVNAGRYDFLLRVGNVQSSTVFRIPSSFDFILFGKPQFAPIILSP